MGCLELCVLELQAGTRLTHSQMDG